jgi:hypothetical protein
MAPAQTFHDLASALESGVKIVAIIVGGTDKADASGSAGIVKQVRLRPSCLYQEEEVRFVVSVKTLLPSPHDRYWVKERPSATSLGRGGFGPRDKRK